MCGISYVWIRWGFVFVVCIFEIWRRRGRSDGGENVWVERRRVYLNGVYY